MRIPTLDRPNLLSDTPNAEYRNLCKKKKQKKKKKKDKQTWKKKKKKKKKKKRRLGHQS